VSERALTWSYGGGTQSIAIAVLVARGDLPTPECVVIADTGREATETWEYLDAHVRPLLASVGVEVEIAPHSLATTTGLYAINGDLLLPMFTAAGGKLPTLCSNEWKKRVVGRYLRAKGYGPKKPVTTWIGMSIDEVERAKPSGVKWQEYAWPLLFDVPMRRDECRQLVRDAGLPDPPKSSCYMCPHRQNHQWRHIRDNYPEDWGRAIAIDRLAREKDERGGVYVHRSRVPLEEADIDTDTKEPSFFDGCDSGFCFV
jgi:hypothetical protein